MMLFQRKKTIFCILLFLGPVLYGQNQKQVALLEKAYRDSSETLLYEFFDNWSNEVSSNGNEASNPWVAEAHKVFAAFYQPLQPDKIGCGGNEFQVMYQDYPYFIVQDTLYGIYMTEILPYRKNELVDYYTNRINRMYPDDSTRKVEMASLKRMIENDNLDADFIPDWYNISSWMAVPITLVDSNISFRPHVAFPNKKIVYLTSGYVQLLNAFLRDDHVDWGTESIMTVAYAMEESQKRMEFFEKAALIFYGHWGGYWQYETYPKASSIIFDSQMQRAVVYFRFVYEGGEVFLEKQNGKWTVVSGQLTWIE